MPLLTVHVADQQLQFEFTPGMSVRDILDTTHLRVRAACGGTGGCGACVITVLKGGDSPHTLAEYLKLSPDLRQTGMRLACQIRPDHDVDIALADPAPVSPWKSLPSDHGLPPILSPMGDSAAPYGVAVDLGTSHIRLALWDCHKGLRIATRMGPNPQTMFGADILNRLGYAMGAAGQRADVAVVARQAIMAGLRDMLARDVGEVTPMLGRIGRVVVVGNTAMTSLLCESGVEHLLCPEYWQRPIDAVAPERGEWLRDWPLPRAEVLVMPSLAGFIGSDLLADCLATGLVQGPAGSVLVDVGTNTELAVWDGTVLHVTSVSGGPAFEGAGIACGMVAEPGAIFRVRSRPEGLECSPPAAPDCDVIGGGPVAGLCGSGLIDAVAWMLKSKILKPSGRFAVPVAPEGYRLIPHQPRSAVNGLAVDALQRAKASIAAALDILLQQAGMGWQEVPRLVVCGSFGRHLGIPQAQTIGLLPSIAVDKIELCADAALTGAEAALLTQDASTLFTVLRGMTKPLNLALIGLYDDHFISHLRLRPFPSVPGPCHV